MSSDIQSLSDEALMEAWSADAATATALKERLKAYSAEYQNRCLREQAVNLMGEDALASLIQNAGPAPVESGEVVGTPGSDEEASDG